MIFLLRYLKQHKNSIFTFLLFCTIFGCVFVLYHLPIEAVLYPALLCALLGLFFIGADCKKSYERHQLLVKLQNFGAELLCELPATRTIEGVDYQQLVRTLCRQQEELKTAMNEKYFDMIEYYTLWAHQIKTPIAAMRLNLQNEDSDFSRQLSEDLQRIEQYVEMVLAFLRLDSASRIM